MDETDLVDTGDRRVKRRRFVEIAGLSVLVPLLTIRRAGATDEGWAVALGLIAAGKVVQARALATALNDHSSSDFKIQTAAVTKFGVSSVKWIVVKGDPSYLASVKQFVSRHSLCAAVVADDPDPLKVTGPFRGDQSPPAKQFRALLNQVLETPLDQQPCPLLTGL